MGGRESEKEIGFNRSGYLRVKPQLSGGVPRLLGFGTGDH